MHIILEHAREIEGRPLPGDVVLWRFGRCYSHGAIVIEWPTVIHAYLHRTCSLEDAEAAAWLNIVGDGEGDRGRPRPRKFFSYWGAGK